VPPPELVGVGDEEFAIVRVPIVLSPSLASISGRLRREEAWGGRSARR
jgi:hypothetical protein